MAVGYLLGTFDLLNVGDLDLIAQVRARVDRLVLAVYGDEHVLTGTGRAPVVPLTERVALLRHVRGVDEVVVLDDEQLPPQAERYAAYGDVLADREVPRLGHRASSSAMLRDALWTGSAEPAIEDVA